MNDREKQLESALRKLLCVVETFPSDSADARAVYGDATEAAREALRKGKASRRESRDRELVA